MGFRVAYTETLREVPDSLEDVETARRHHERMVGEFRRDLARWGTDTDRVRVARELCRLANALRFLDRLEEAEEALREAIGLYTVADRAAAVILSRARLAVVRQWRGFGKEAAEMLTELLPLTAVENGFPVYRDLVHQLRGLCRAELADPEGALADLEEALSIRRLRGNEKSVEETAQLIEWVRDAFEAFED